MTTRAQIKQRSEDNAVAFLVDCPDCKAKPHDMCRGPRGGLSSVHRSRVQKGRIYVRLPDINNE